VDDYFFRFIYHLPLFMVDDMLCAILHILLMTMRC